MKFLSYRKQLADPKVSWQLCLLCSIGGLFAALFIVVFIATIEMIQNFFNVTNDDYTTLSAISRFDLPIIGAVVILLFSWLTGYKYTRTGIPFVLHHLKIDYGVIPFRNTFHQFIGGVVSLSTGFSVGREGPVVHLGAAASSFVGRYFSLPYNSIRTLCAAGIAAGIAASFNTPIAAVIFVLEVILRDYDVHVFIPIMLAAIIGSVVTSSVFGTFHFYDFSTTVPLNIEHLPLIILIGLIIGLLASTFNHSIILILKRFNQWHIVTRFMIAALITGTFGFAFPLAMGTGSSAIVFLQSHHPTLLMISGLLTAKFVMTTFAIGLGITGGIIGPILGIGAIAGACAGSLVQVLYPEYHLITELTILGMAAFMAATLNAPLAALLAVVELSHQLDMMLPAMAIITSSCLISGQFFKNESIFDLQLKWQQLPFKKPPIETALQKIGVLSKLRTQFVLVNANIHTSELISTLSTTKAAILCDEASETIDKKFVLIQSKSPGMKQSLLPLSSQATLAEAYIMLHKIRKGGVYIYEDDIHHPIGYITFKHLRNYLLSGKTNN